MVHALLVLAADEPSKAPFYICGGALVVWAVLLSAIGLTQPDFPRGEGAARGVMGLSALLVVAALATSVITA